MVYTSKSEKETYAIARSLAKEAKGGDIFLLSGDLGGGKTTFARGFCNALGIKEIITSPTFVVMKNYVLFPSKNGISEVAHADCYRVNEIESIGLAEYMNRPDVVLLIEWPEMISSFLPQKAKKINFEYINEATRKIEVE